MQENIKEIGSTFLEQADNSHLAKSHFPSSYDGLKLKVGFGVGKPAKIPWITFLGEGQKPQRGIFPVYYYFKVNHKLVLAYGISETEKAKMSWTVSPDTKTIVAYFRQYGIVPYKYGLSYVCEAYDTTADLDWIKMETDLDNLLHHYKTLLQKQ